MRILTKHCNDLKKWLMEKSLQRENDTQANIKSPGTFER